MVKCLFISLSFIFSLIIMIEQAWKMSGIYMKTKIIKSQPIIQQ